MSYLTFNLRPPLTSDRARFKASLDPMGWYLWSCDPSVFNCDDCRQHDGKCFLGKDVPDWPPHDWCYCNVTPVPLEFVVAQELAKG